MAVSFVGCGPLGEGLTLALVLDGSALDENIVLISELFDAQAAV